MVCRIKWFGGYEDTPPVIFFRQTRRSALSAKQGSILTFKCGKTGSASLKGAILLVSDDVFAKISR